MNRTNIDFGNQRFRDGNSHKRKCYAIAKQVYIVDSKVFNNVSLQYQYKYMIAGRLNVCYLCCVKYSLPVYCPFTHYRLKFITTLHPVFPSLKRSPPRKSYITFKRIHCLEDIFPYMYIKLFTNICVQVKALYRYRSDNGKRLLCFVATRLLVAKW